MDESITLETQIPLIEIVTHEHGQSIASTDDTRPFLRDSSAKWKIKQRVGTRDGGHRHEEWPRPCPGLAAQLSVVPDFAYRERSAFSPRDNR